MRLTTLKTGKVCQPWLAVDCVLDSAGPWLVHLFKMNCWMSTPYLGKLTVVSHLLLWLFSFIFFNKFIFSVNVNDRCWKNYWYCRFLRCSPFDEYQVWKRQVEKSKGEFDKNIAFYCCNFMSSINPHHVHVYWAIHKFCAERVYQHCVRNSNWEIINSVQYSFSLYELS